MKQSNVQSIVRLALGASVLLGTTACFFDLSRGAELNPGDVSGRALLEDGTSAGYARVVVDGTGRTKRADSDGAFVISDLDAGTWALRVDFDLDGDGWPEGVAHRTVTIITTESGERSSTLLGDIVLLTPSSLRGEIELPPGVSRSGVDVSVVRDASLAVDGETFSADQAVQARVATDANGQFYFPALARGDSILRARVRTASGDLYAANDVSTSIDLGPNTLNGPIVLSLVPEAPAIDGDILPPGEVVSAERREAVLFATPKDDTGERFVVDIVRTGFLPRPADFDGPRVFSAGDDIVLDNVPFGVFDVYIRTSLNRNGVLYQRFVGPGEGSLAWGIIQLGQLLCPNDDCDADGIPGLPALADSPAIWDDCETQCVTGSTFAIGPTATATCTVDSVVYDCEDDGDGQPDTTEPACYGLALGGDHDGDTLCDPVDPYPFCASNNERCDIEEVTGLYGIDPIVDVDGGPLPDAGPNDDGGPAEDAGVDAGPEGDAGVDAGPITDAGVDGGPIVDVDGGLDGGPLVDAGFDAGVDPDPEVFVFPDPINPVRQTPEVIFGDDNGGFYLFGDVGEGGNTPGSVDCVDEDPVPLTFIWGYYAHFDADGVCQRLSYTTAQQGASIKKRFFRDGTGFAVAVVAAIPISVGRNAAGDVVNNNVVGDRIILVRLDADLNVVSSHHILTNSDSQQPYGVAPFLVRMSPTETLLVGNPRSVSITYVGDSGVNFSGTGNLAVLQLDGDLDLTGAFNAGGENGDSLDLIAAVKHNDGVALSLTGDGTAFGAPVDATSTILRLDSAMVRLDAVTTDLVTVDQLVSNGTDLHASGKTIEDPSGMFVFRPSFAQGAAINLSLNEPGGVATSAGSVSGVTNLNTAAFDPVTRSILSVGSNQIQASPFPTAFGDVPQQIAVANFVRDIAIDANTRDLFYIDNSNLLFRCDLDACVNPVQIASFATSVDVDDVGNKIYYLGSGLTRANYDGTGTEFGFASTSSSHVALDPVGRVFFVEAVGAFLRYEMDDVGAPAENLGPSPGFVSQLEIDPISGRLYWVASNLVQSTDQDGNAFATTTVNGGTGGTQALFPIVAALPAVTAGGSTVDVDFARTVLMRFPDNGTGSVVPLGTLAGGVPNVTVSDMVHARGELTVAASVIAGNIEIAGTTVDPLNERDGPSEVFVARFSDDGTTLIPQWMTPSAGSEPMNMRRIDVDAAGNTFGIVRTGFEGVLGTAAATTREQNFNFPTNIWRLPPQGDPGPTREFLAAGGREAGDILGADFDATFTLPFRDTGYVAVGEVSPGTYYVTRELPGSSPWRHELPYQPVALDVSPEGEAIAVLFRFASTFDFLGESQTATDGLAVVVFTADGAIASAGYTELNGASVHAVAVNDSGRVAVGYTVATTMTLDLQRAVPVPLNENGGFLVRYDDGFATATFGGDPATTCDTVDVDDDGALVAAMNSGGNQVRVLHVDPDATFDWEVNLSTVDNTMAAQQVRLSRAGGLVALGVITDGDAAISVVSDCAPSGYSELPDDAHYAVFAFRANGCDSGFGRILASALPASNFKMDIVDRANNIVVVGGYEPGVTVSVETDSTIDPEINITSPDPGMFVAGFHTQFYRLRARSVYAATNINGFDLRGLGAATNGDVWIHALTDPGGVQFSDLETEVTLTNGMVWILDLQTATDGVAIR